MSRNELCGAERGLRNGAGRMRRGDHVRGLREHAVLRWRRPEPLRHHALQGEDLRGGRRAVRKRIGRMWCGAVLRVMPTASGVWRRQQAERMRVQSQDVRGAGSAVRVGGRRLRQHRELRGLSFRAILRQHGSEQVWHHAVQGQDVCGAGSELRQRVGRMLRYAAMRKLHAATDVRGGWDPECVRLHAHDVRSAGQVVREHQRSVRRHDSLRRLRRQPIVHRKQLLVLHRLQAMLRNVHPDRFVLRGWGLRGWQNVHESYVWLRGWPEAVRRDLHSKRIVLHRRRMRGRQGMLRGRVRVRVGLAPVRWQLRAGRDVLHGRGLLGDVRVRHAGAGVCMPHEPGASADVPLVLLERRSPAFAIAVRGPECGVHRRRRCILRVHDAVPVGPGASVSGAEHLDERAFLHGLAGRVRRAGGRGLVVRRGCCLHRRQQRVRQRAALPARVLDARVHHERI